MLLVKSCRVRLHTRAMSLASIADLCLGGSLLDPWSLDRRLKCCLWNFVQRCNLSLEEQMSWVIVVTVTGHAPLETTGEWSPVILQRTLLEVG